MALGRVRVAVENRQTGKLVRARACACVHERALTVWPPCGAQKLVSVDREGSDMVAELASAVSAAFDCEPGSVAALSASSGHPPTQPSAAVAGLLDGWRAVCHEPGAVVGVLRCEWERVGAAGQDVGGAWRMRAAERRCEARRPGSSGGAARSDGSAWCSVCSPDGCSELALGGWHAGVPAAPRHTIAAVDVSQAEDGAVFSFVPLEESEAEAAASARARVYGRVPRRGRLTTDEYRRRNWVNMEGGFVAIKGDMSEEEEREMYRLVVCSAPRTSSVGRAGLRGRVRVGARARACVRVQGGVRKRR